MAKILIDEAVCEYCQNHYDTKFNTGPHNLCEGSYCAEMTTRIIEEITEGELNEEDYYETQAEED